MDLAADDGFCILNVSYTAVPPPCPADSRPAAELRTDAAFRQLVLRAWSMEDFSASASGESGHDHFFARFGKFGAVSERHPGKLLAEVLDTAAAHRQLYQELMITPASAAVEALANEVGHDADLAALHRRLTAEGRMAAVVRTARTEADATVANFRATSDCDGEHPRPGCSVPFRFLSLVLREEPPQRVFARMTLAMQLASVDERFVAVNLVQPEDGEVALRDYRLHMRMLDFLHARYPRAHITLHAGELAAGLVKPAELRFHISDAVTTGHAERIGHGVDIREGDGWPELLRRMAERGIAVEVALTSNAQILGVSGARHPFPLYRARGVPVVLATDDRGVSRTTVSDEYLRAARTYSLTYRELKDLARASLDHSFLAGRSLWTGPGRVVPACAGVRPGGKPSGRCAEYLHTHPKAALEWRQEAAFALFEHRLRRSG